MSFIVLYTDTVASNMAIAIWKWISLIVCSCLNEGIYFIKIYSYFNEECYSQLNTTCSLFYTSISESTGYQLEYI